MWANRLSAQWDAYLRENPPCRSGRGPPQLILMALPEIRFRTEDMNVLSTINTGIQQLQIVDGVHRFDCTGHPHSSVPLSGVGCEFLVHNFELAVVFVLEVADIVDISLIFAVRAELEPV